jgi:hypothetical protein
MGQGGSAAHGPVGFRIRAMAAQRLRVRDGPFKARESAHCVSRPEG